MYPCCENLKNRTEPEQVEDKPDLTVTYCKVCGRRHFELEVDPVKIGVEIGSLSGR